MARKSTGLVKVLNLNLLYSGNEESLVVSFIDLEAHSAILSYYVSACPIEVLPIFDEVALDVVLDWFEGIPCRH